MNNSKMTNKEVYNEYKKIMKMIGLAVEEEKEEKELEEYKKSIVPALKQLKTLQDALVEEMNYTQEEAKEMVKALVIEALKKGIRDA